MTGAIFPTGAIDITPSDTVVFDPPLYGIRCNGAGGNLAFIDGYGAKHTAWVIATGETISVVVKQILASGTTATGLSSFKI